MSAGLDRKRIIEREHGLSGLGPLDAYRGLAYDPQTVLGLAGRAAQLAHVDIGYIKAEVQRQEQFDDHCFPYGVFVELFRKSGRICPLCWKGHYDEPKSDHRRDLAQSFYREVCPNFVVFVGREQAWSALDQDAGVMGTLCVGCSIMARRGVENCHGGEWQTAGAIATALQSPQCWRRARENSDVRFRFNPTRAFATL